MTDGRGAGARNRGGRPARRKPAWRRARPLAHRLLHPATLRFLLASLLAIAVAAPVAQAGRPLTRVEAAELRVLAARARALRPAATDRRRAAADQKKRTRDAKMAAALQMAADYKAEKARKQAARDAARQREKNRRNTARLRLVEELLRTRADRAR